MNPDDVHADTTCVARVTPTCQAVYERTKIPSVCCEHEDARMVVVFSHGNSENVVTSAWFLAYLCKTFQAEVYGYEYPGYFAHSGEQSTTNACEAGCFDSSAIFVGEIARHEREGRGLLVVLVGYSFRAGQPRHSTARLYTATRPTHSSPHQQNALARFYTNTARRRRQTHHTTGQSKSGSSPTTPAWTATTMLPSSLRFCNRSRPPAHPTVRLQLGT
jgi:hypothetical protein